MAPRVLRHSHRHVRGRRALPLEPEEPLAPSSEVPRGGLGIDRSRPAAGVQELSWASFDAHVQALARSIIRSFTPEAVVGVAHGGVFVGGALASALGADFFPVRISRRSRISGAAGKRPRLSGSMPKELKGRRVLIVDDVSASGETLRLAKKLALKAGARALRTATLVSRTDGYAADFTVLKSDALFVFPWDYADVTEDARFDTVPAVPSRVRVRK
jgi:hypoxanthine phosphoribosyltransferase